MKTSEGTFTDKHESPDNVEDRNERFLPQYAHYYNNSPHQSDFMGQENLIENDLRIMPFNVDGVEDTSDKDSDIKHTITMETSSVRRVSREPSILAARSRLEMVQFT